MPYDTPNMGMNYGDLARLSAPQMMPNAPMGAGAMAGGMYFADKARQDQALQGASGLAQMDAEMKARAADEYSRAGVGRDADINVANALAKGREEGIPSMVGTQADTIETKAIGAKSAKAQAMIEQVSPFAEQWMAAKSDWDRAGIIDDMRKAGINKIGPKAIDEISMNQMDEVMKRVSQAAVNTPKHRQKLDEINATGEQAYKREQLKAQTRLKVEQMAEDIKRELSDKKILNTLPDPNRVVFNTMLKRGVPLEDASAWYQSVQNTQAAAKAGNGPQQLDLSPDMSGVSPRNPQTPAPPAFPAGARGPMPPPAAAPAAPPLGGGPQAASAPMAAKPPKAVAKEEALRILSAMKGKPQYETARAFYKSTYGEDAPQ